MQSLSARAKTTAEIAVELKDVPVSSLYRHLKLLLDGLMITVVETRMVQGIEEKRYELAQEPRVQHEDLIGAAPEAHLNYFATYLLTLLHGFGRYLEEAADIDYAVDRTGYTEVDLEITVSEFDELSKKLNEAIMPLLKNKPASDRQRRKLAIITFPLKNIGE